jgi:diaminopimelate epimerase
MIVPFKKYHGTGNDFVMIDNMAGTVHLSDKDVVKICDRHFGIGSDGLILLEKAKDGLHFSMNFFNPDASKSFCGNGSRCAVKFAHDLGYIPHEVQFSAIDGVHDGVIENGRVSVHMRDTAQWKQLGDSVFFFHTGSPHHIVFQEKIGEVDILATARPIRYSEEYAPNGTNVNFVEIETEGQVYVRTYERGVEDETLSCGTGVTAVALACGLKWPNLEVISIRTKGGNLEVRFDRDGDLFHGIYLTGPAEKSFEGYITI